MGYYSGRFSPLKGFVEVSPVFGERYDWVVVRWLTGVDGDWSWVSGKTWLSFNWLVIREDDVSLFFRRGMALKLWLHGCGWQLRVANSEARAVLTLKMGMIHIQYGGYGRQRRGGSRSRYLMWEVEVQDFWRWETDRVDWSSWWLLMERRTTVLNLYLSVVGDGDDWHWSSPTLRNRDDRGSWLFVLGNGMIDFEVGPLLLDRDDGRWMLLSNGVGGGDDWHWKEWRPVIFSVESRGSGLWQARLSVRWWAFAMGDIIMIWEWWHADDSDGRDGLEDKTIQDGRR